jgi:hypothetical protein
MREREADGDKLPPLSPMFYGTHELHGYRYIMDCRRLFFPLARALSGFLTCRKKMLIAATAVEREWVRAAVFH